MKYSIPTFIQITGVLVFLGLSSGTHGQCTGFPSTVSEQDCSLFPALFNNATLNPGDTVGFCATDASEVTFTGVNLFGGVIRICGNMSLSGNFNSGTIVVQCGSSLRIPSDVTFNNGIKLINYGNVEINGNLNLQNINNAFYNELDSSRFIVDGNLNFPQNSGQNAYLKNNGYIQIGGDFNAIDGGFCCFSNGSVLQCNNFHYIMNCGGPSNRFTSDGSGGPAIIRYQNQANIRATLTSSSNISIHQATGSNVNFHGCGSFGSATVVPNAPTISDPGNSNTGCISSCFTLLTVELTDFTGTCDEKKIVLNWTTSSERDNDYFLVEKSSDAIHFEKIGMVDGKGTTTQTSSYFWEDSNLSPFNYYRLVQVDFDGKTTICKTIAVKNCVNKDVTIYPNPCNNWITINLRSNKKTSFSLVDISGTVMLTGSVSNEKNKIHLENLARGIYYLNLEENTYPIVKN